MKLDYEKLGFKAGIEIHQQLDTHKLFCECPSEMRDDQPDFIVKRKMRAVAGELGDVDPAALHEFLRDKEFIYEAYSNSNCLVELDEEPPHPLNREALDICLEVSLLLNARPVDELQVMRKTVIDGSNTSGFQRTVLIAMDGYIETKEGRVRIPSISLEEDAARKIREEDNTIVYRLDRLGIPLIELGTEPDIKNPNHAREVAEKLGMILRATGKVKRGLGTIRQDLNVSITGGERIEIKGVQDLRSISRIMRGEVRRQLMLIDVKDELKKRDVDIKNKFVDVTLIFRNSESRFISKMIKEGSSVMAVRLGGFGGLLKEKLGPELSQYAKAMANVGGIFHSNELPGYGISEGEVKDVSAGLGLEEEDAFVMVVERKDIAKKALKEIVKRCRISLDGVPREVRKAREDGTTEFMRPLPGSARMYPETDEPPIVVGKEVVSEIRERLSMLPEEMEEKFIGLGLGRELTEQLIRSRWSKIFNEFVSDYPNIKPSLIAVTLLSTPKEVKKRYEVEVGVLGKRHYRDILGCLSEEKIVKESIAEIMAELAKNPGREVVDILKEQEISVVSGEEVDKVVDKVIQKNIDFIRGQGMRAVGPLVGKVMAELKGGADGQMISSKIRKQIKDIQ